MFAIIVPPIAAIFLLGVFYRRGNGQGAFAPLLAGFAMGVVLVNGAPSTEPVSL